MDKGLKLYKGRQLFKQYIPLKQSRFGIKVFFACEDSGYTYRFRVYQGKEGPVEDINDDLPADARNMLQSEKMVVRLMRPLLGHGYSVYMDNWYTFAHLFEYLHSKSTEACGTVRSNTVPAQLRETA